MLPTDEEVAALKAKHDGLALVEIEDEAFVVRPPTRPEYEAYFGERHDSEGSLTNAEANLLTATVVWPSKDKTEKVLDGHAGYASTLAEYVVELGGGSIDLIAGLAAQPLSNLVKGEREQLIAEGYALTAIEKRGDRYFFVRGPIGPIVYRHPSRAAYSTYRDKLVRQGLKLATGEQLCFDCVDHPKPEALAAMFARWPVLIGYHAAQLRNASGANAEARGKKI